MNLIRRLATRLKKWILVQETGRYVSLISFNDRISSVKKCVNVSDYRQVACVTWHLYKGNNCTKRILCSFAQLYTFIWALSDSILSLSPVTTTTHCVPVYKHLAVFLCVPPHIQQALRCFQWVVDEYRRWSEIAAFMNMYPSVMFRCVCIIVCCCAFARCTHYYRHTETHKWTNTSPLP